MDREFYADSSVRRHVEAVIEAKGFTCPEAVLQFFLWIKAEKRTADVQLDSAAHALPDQNVRIIVHISKGSGAASDHLEECQVIACTDNIRGQTVLNREDGIV